MSNVKNLHNNVLYKVALDVTQQYMFFLDATTKKNLDLQVSEIVKDDLFSIYADYEPTLVSWSYESDYVTCDESFEEFMNEEKKTED